MNPDVFLLCKLHIALQSFINACVNKDNECYQWYNAYPNFSSICRGKVQSPESTRILSAIGPTCHLKMLPFPWWKLGNNGDKYFIQIKQKHKEPRIMILRTLLGMWLFIHAGIEINPYYQSIFCISDASNGLEPDILLSMYIPMYW